ncbi:hypothetical protein Daus18300_007499 [Diaporthe australafricana]|uniref:N-acetyltransferase domain-containing protein n=1 Tax=Diaporthe australafricana TaxID=127596 RepID=A0ABR3WMI4_9PEZI
MAPESPKTIRSRSDNTQEGIPSSNVQDKKSLNLWNGIQKEETAELWKCELGGMEASAFVFNRETQFDVIKPQLTQQDIALAEELVRGLWQRYLEPNKSIRIIVEPTKPVLLDTLDGFQVVSQTLRKTIKLEEHNKPPIPPGGFYEYMTHEEAKDFLAATEETFAKNYIEHLTGRSWNLPWKKKSICRFVEVEPEKRRMGFGARALAVWEYISFERSARTMWAGLVGENKAAEKMFSSSGYVEVARMFRISE